MKKSFLIGLGLLAGVATLAAIGGIVYAANASVRDSVNNGIGKLVNDDGIDLKGISIKSTLDLNKDQARAQGVQTSANEPATYQFRFALDGVPTYYDGEDILITKLIRGNENDISFHIGTYVGYSSVTHESGASFEAERVPFKKDEQSESYTLRTYWVEHPSVYKDTKITFTSDFVITSSSSEA